MSGEIIQKGKDDVCQVMECVGLSTLECGAHILKIKRHVSIGKCTPRWCESSLVLILQAYPFLIVIEESIHEGKDFMTRTCINNLVDKRCRVVIFREFPI